MYLWVNLVSDAELDIGLYFLLVTSENNFCLSYNFIFFECSSDCFFYKLRESDFVFFYFATSSCVYLSGGVAEDIYF